MRSKEEIILSGIIFIVLGLAVCSYIAYKYLESKHGKTWPVANGVIEISRIDKHRNYYYARIKYSYMVNGKKYSGDRVRFGWNRILVREEVVNIINKYSVGSIADVYYNPKKPSKSVLEPILILPSDFLAILFSSIFYVVLGPGWFVIGIMMLIRWEKFIE